ncbi:182 kDa tankyrase-1-binding protein [Chaetodon auriga]|uniref:182 kDa tankyrase-1-binding protein n=1 Tax=Chaetodon auriga TaxID=39042 RepID=UPI004032B0BF
MESSIEASQTGDISKPKPALCPKPRLAPKPFSLQKNTSIRSIHAPKTFAAASKTAPQQAEKFVVTSAPRVRPALPTLVQQPATSDSKPGSVSELTKEQPKTSKESKAVPHGEDTLDSSVAKSDPAPQTAPPKETPKSGPIQKDDVVQTNHKASTDTNSEQQDGKKEEDETQTSVVQKLEESGSDITSSANPAYPRGSVRKRLPTELTSKFQSGGPPLLPQPTITVSTPSTKADAKKPESSDPEQIQTTSEPSNTASDEGGLKEDYGGGSSIKRRISLLFDSSSRPEVKTRREDPEILNGTGGVKARIKNWTTETSSKHPKAEGKPQAVPRSHSKSSEPATPPAAEKTPKTPPVEPPAPGTSSGQAVELHSKDSPAEQPTETPVETSKDALTAEKAPERPKEVSGEQMEIRSEGDVQLRNRSPSPSHPATDEEDSASESAQHAVKRDNVKRRSVRFGVVEKDDGGPPVILGSESESSEGEGEEEEKNASEDEAEEDIAVPVYKRIGMFQKKDEEVQEQEAERLKHFEFEKKRRAEENEEWRLKLEEEQKQKEEEEREREKVRQRKEEEERERERLKEEEMERERKEERERERLKEEERERERLREEEMERERKEERERERLKEEERERERLREEEMERERKEERERERLKEEERERERLREEEMERERKEERERERLKEEERERERLREEEMERERKEEWERERLKEEERERERLREEEMERERKEEWERERLKEEERERERLREEEMERERQMELMWQRQREEERERAKEERLKHDQEERERERLKEEERREERLREERERQRLREEEERSVHEHEEHRLEGKLREEEMNKEKEREEEWEKEWVKKTARSGGEEEEGEESKREKEERLRQEEREKERLREEAEEGERQRRLKEQQEKEEETERMRHVEEEKQREEEERKRQIEKERVEELERKMQEELERKRAQELEEQLRPEEERGSDGLTNREGESMVDEPNLISFDSEDVPQKSQPPYSPFAKEPTESLVDFDDFSVRQPPHVDFDDFSVKTKRWGSHAKVEPSPVIHIWAPDPVDKEEVELLVPLDVSPQEKQVPEQVEEADSSEPTLAQDSLEREEEEETKEGEAAEEEDEMKAQVNSYCTDGEDKDTDALIDLQNEACEPTPEIDSPVSIPDKTPEYVDTTDSHTVAELFPFPESSTPLLDNSAQRSKADLGKRRIRTRPSRSFRAGLDQRGSLDWRTCDSIDEKEAPSKQRDSDSEEDQPKPKVVCSPPPTSQRVPVFPGLSPAALLAQLKRKTGGGGPGGGEEAEEDKGADEKDSQKEEVAPSPSQPSRSPRSAAHLAGAARVLPPLGGTDGGAVSSPAWLKELKSKKRLSQYDGEA